MRAATPPFGLSEALVVCDLDGTLLDAHAALSPHSAAVLGALLEGGAAFTVATARSWTSAARVLAGARLRLRLPVITYAGALTVDPRDGTASELALLDERVVAAVLEACPADAPVQPVFFAMCSGRDRVCWHEARPTAGTQGFLATRQGDPRLLPLASWADLDPTEVFFVSLIGADGEVQDLLRRLAPVRELGHVVLSEDVYDAGTWWLELTSPQGTKGEAVRRLRRSLGGPPVVAIGDNANDLPLFEAADFRVAVANAVPALKERADAVIGANTEDGVARWLSAWAGRGDT